MNGGHFKSVIWGHVPPFLTPQCRINQEDILDRVGALLATVTADLFIRVRGAWNASFAAIVAKGGEGARCSAGGISRARWHARQKLRKLRKIAGWRITKPAKGRLEHGEERMGPHSGLALGHAKHRSVDFLERIGFQKQQDEEQPLFGSW